MSDSSSPPGTSQAEGAQEKVQEVAGQAQEKVQEAGTKAQDMLRDQVDQRSTQAGEKVSGTAGDLRSVSEELRSQGKETPAKLADKAAERTEQLGSYLTDADRLLADVEDLGRRQPLVVLAGGIVVGLAAARFLKASSRSRYQDRTSWDSTKELQTPSPPLPAYEGTEPIGAGAAVPTQAPTPADPALRR
jgi:hypothetical protein